MYTLPPAPQFLMTQLWTPAMNLYQGTATPADVQILAQTTVHIALGIIFAIGIEYQKSLLLCLPVGLVSVPAAACGVVMSGAKAVVTYTRGLTFASLLVAAAIAYSSWRILTVFDMAQNLGLLEKGIQQLSAQFAAKYSATIINFIQSV